MVALAGATVVTSMYPRELDLCLIAVVAIQVACVPEGRAPVGSPSGGSGAGALRDSGIPHAMLRPDAGFIDGGAAPKPDAAVPRPDAMTSTPDAGTVQNPDTGVVAPMGLPILGAGSHSMTNVEMTVIADSNDALDEPYDLAFNPAAPDELWVTNHGTSSIVIIDALDSASPRADHVRDFQSGRHFLARPSGIAFGMNGAFATSQAEDRVTQSTTPADFMGPTLWSADRRIFDGGHNGHLDMLHNSPNGMGIAWDSANIYWYFDGGHSAIARYDFNSDHGPGGTDHRDGEISRYAEGEVAMVPRVPSHLAMDHATGRLYIADTGNNRIAYLDTRSGTRGGSIGPNYDGCRMFGVRDAVVQTVIDGRPQGLTRPAGLELHDGMIFVSDNGTGRIHAFSMQGDLIDYLDTGLPAGALMGMAFDDAGRLYVAEIANHRILRIAPRE